MQRLLGKGLIILFYDLVQYSATKLRFRVESYICLFGYFMPIIGFPKGNTFSQGLTLAS